MAHRIISQVIIIGSRVVGRAFVEAYKQASASSRYAAANQGVRGATTSSDRAHAGLSLHEACQILDVKVPDQKGTLTGLTMEEVADRYKRLFDSNDPKKGGSFYIQSKVVRAKERVESQLNKEESIRSEMPPEGGYKIYKD